MANLHAKFGKFHDKIALTSAKKKFLRTSRDAVRERIRKYFRDTLKVKVPKFHQQGSFPMVTTIIPLNGEFDVDDGVYLQHLDETDDSDWPEPSEVHRWLVEATAGQTNEKPIDKETCVRVQYAGQYHIDMPSYATRDGVYYLSKKKGGWFSSDPKAITDWFRGEVADQGEQLRRMVRCIKAWADYQAQERGEFVSSIILTVLVAEEFISDERDDQAMKKTAEAVWQRIRWGVNVYNPKDSSECMSDRLSEDQKTMLQKAFEELSRDAGKALSEADEGEASKTWRGLLGDRFPKVETKEEKDARKLAAAIITPNSLKPWCPQNG
jgi:hypothetical protein